MATFIHFRKLLIILLSLYEAKGQIDTDCPRGRCFDGRCPRTKFELCPEQDCPRTRSFLNTWKRCDESLECLPPNRLCPEEREDSSWCINGMSVGECVIIITCVPGAVLFLGFTLWAVVSSMKEKRKKDREAIPISMPRRSNVGPKLVRRYRHRIVAGPMLDRRGMLTGTLPAVTTPSTVATSPAITTPSAIPTPSAVTITSAVTTSPAIPTPSAVTITSAVTTSPAVTTRSAVTTSPAVTTLLAIFTPPAIPESRFRGATYMNDNRSSELPFQLPNAQHSAVDLPPLYSDLLSDSASNLSSDLRFVKDPPAYAEVVDHPDLYPGVPEGNASGRGGQTRKSESDSCDKNCMYRQY